ncbi:hypothetical protein [Puerhibacterium sp. TATVAM-FAB25]|uniref:hypothetical protein n=1 Tax=Puerhibacterium sp. TATVAM-FAB25 TaxID=3093699 RepID=UPI00397E31B7
MTASPAAGPDRAETGPVATSAVDRDGAGAPALRWAPDPLLGAPYVQAPLGPATLVRGPTPIGDDAGPRRSRGRVPELPPGADAAAQDAALERHGAVLVPLTPPGTARRTTPRTTPRA